MTDKGPRALARKDLRDYDNPKGGRNKNYGDRAYLNNLLDKYQFANEEAFRVWANERKHTKQHKWS